MNCSTCGIETNDGLRCDRCRQPLCYDCLVMTVNLDLLCNACASNYQHSNGKVSNTNLVDSMIVSQQTNRLSTALSMN